MTTYHLDRKGNRVLVVRDNDVRVNLVQQGFGFLPHERFARTYAIKHNAKIEEV